MDWLTFAKKQIRMLTKYYIEIDGARSEIPKECINNWDEIKCVYKRADYSGVTRSFSSQFEFVGEMYDRLMALYLRDGVNAVAVLSLYVITDRWEWEEQFTCPLDFSTITWDNYILKLNCVDNSLATIIKAKKSTKYEFRIGNELELDEVMVFNRLPIEEGLTYEFTGGRSDENDGSLYMPATENNRLYMGVLSDELITVGGMVDFNDDQTTDPDSYILKAVQPLSMNVAIDVEYDQTYGTKSVNCSMVVIHANGSVNNISNHGASFTIGSARLEKKGDYTSEAALRNDWPHDTIYVNGAAKENYWATVNGIVWQVRYKGSGERTDWENQRVTVDKFRRRTVFSRFSVDLNVGDKIALVCNGGASHIYSSGFKFSRMARGASCSMPAFTPETIGNRIIRTMCAGKLNATVRISSYDPRIAKTFLVAAESIRGITGAKFYSSFNEFCEWMETVFGYTYYIGGEVSSPYKYYRHALGGFSNTPYGLTETPWGVDHSTTPQSADIVYFACYKKFAAYDGHKWYANFPGDSSFNDPATGQPRTDTIFRLKRWINSVLTERNYYFVKGSDGEVLAEPKEYKGDVSDIYKVFQSINFVHRLELFNSEAEVKKISNVRGVSYTVNDGSIYSSVTIGYEKKDYGSINGRDEFNFNNTYSTGSSVTDKKLTLKSKYRADCYGMEFAAQKRGADTTDTTSDNNVFFVLCRTLAEGTLVPDTSIKIENAISNEVFNGAFSPLACLDANAGYIGMQSKALHLEFASSDGNSSIVIGGKAMSGDIDITSPLMTCGLLEFTTDDNESPASFDDLIEIENAGWRYRGYISEVSYLFARNESVKYKLIVKDIEPCS